MLRRVSLPRHGTRGVAVAGSRSVRPPRDRNCAPVRPIEARIAQTITILDTIDGDADREDGGKEPSLASPWENQLMWRAVAEDSRDWQNRDMP